jgi:hypothetical protein
MHPSLLAVLAISVMGLQCGAADADEAARAGQPVPLRAGNDIPAYAPQVLKDRAAAEAQEQDSVFARAARAAWQQIEKGYRPATGLVDAQPTWQYPTAWDIASTLAAYYSARGLGLLEDAEYQRRASRLLKTLTDARLYHGIAYGRNYDAHTGELVGPDQKPHQHGTGYSAMDLGRLLVILAVIARNDPELADQARAAATRIDARRVIRNGYLMGTEINPKTRKPEEYQEGRLGYEQYAAAGFDRWGMRATRALDVRTNAASAKVLGIPMTADKRGLDRMTSEPFIMHGLELGWDPAMKEMAWQNLSAQAARFAQTGQMTIASEDAINQPPHYFYYYCVYCSGKPFVINVHSPGVNLDAPRWISTKAAFAWHALAPSKYTWDAVKSVQPALHPDSGWASGVFEGSGKSTSTYTLNTAALILEAALYRKTGKPLIERAR